MSRLWPLAFVLALFIVLPNVSAKERVWTDTAGRTMRAEFVREVDGDVTFLRAGKLITIPLEQLTTADQQVIRDLSAGKPLPEDLPATPREGEFGSSAASSAPSGDAPASTTTSGNENSPLIKQPIPIENRVWTDIHGNQTTARYVRVFGSNVVLSRGGRSITVKYHELTAGDQQYLKELLASRGQESMIPPATSDVGDALSADSSGAPPQGETAESAQGDPSAAAGSGAFDAGGSSTSGRNSGGPGSAPNAPLPYGPSGSAPTRHDAAPPGMALPMATPPGGSSSAGYSPAAAALPPGMSSSFAPTTSSSTTSFSAPATSHYDSGLAPTNPYASTLGERIAYGQPAGYNHSSSIDPIVGACSSCRRSVTQSQSIASNCPHCGIYWSYKQDPLTRQKLPIARLNSAPLDIDPHTARTIGIVIGAFVALLVVVGLIIGVIYAVMGLASISSGPRNRQILH